MNIYNVLDRSNDAIILDNGSIFVKVNFVRVIINSNSLCMMNMFKVIEC